ncbi:EAL domain-containing protein [Pseudomonas sp. P867]|uniref:EAL domain-containing protein n=1 Tax=Pseudomonas sp. P867 TaxID=2816050 RepID=UPI001CA7B3D6|nr:EAL domain-containing protein [Pseudomonas sp. P867]MBY8972745.1 EAL domain-containing protein [Pseudomonas sp. P867]
MRSTVIWQGVIASALVTCLAFGLMGSVGWLMTLGSAELQLQGIADLLSLRAQSTLLEAPGTLKSVASGDLLPCSPESIDQMHLIAVHTLSVKSVGYIQEEIFLCSSWGMIGKKVDALPAYFTTDDSVKISIALSPFLESAKPLMAIEYAAFNVLIDSEQMLDVLFDHRIRLAIATTNSDLIRASSESSGSIVILAHLGPTTGLRDGYLYTSIRQGSWIAVAAIPRAELLSILLRHSLCLLPLGVLIAGASIFGIVRISKRRLSPVAALERAIKNREFVVHYQPIIELEYGRCVGAEALVRWIKPGHGVVPPDLFIPLAEESGLILSITDQVINQVMRDVGDSLVTHRSTHVAINLAASDVSSGRFINVLEKKREQTGVLPSQIWLEATETGFMDLKPAKETMSKARALGYVTALDDFGTGYSSLQNLQQLPLDILKIDKCFVDGISQPKAALMLIDHMLEMADSLGMAVVAEGVETVDQLAYLRDHNVRYAQGWLFAKAMSAEAFISYLGTDIQNFASTSE